MKSFCTHLSGTFPLLSARVSIESGGGEAQYIQSRKLMVALVKWLLVVWTGGMGRLRWRWWGVYLSHRVMGLFRARRASRRPLSGAPSPSAAAATAAWGRTGASGGPGLSWVPRSPPAPTRSEASRTAGPCRLRGSCSVRCWRTPRHFGSAGARCHTPGLRRGQCKERREEWESHMQEGLGDTLLEVHCHASKTHQNSAHYQIPAKLISHHFIFCSVAPLRRDEQIQNSFLQVKCYHSLFQV